MARWARDQESAFRDECGPGSLNMREFKLESSEYTYVGLSLSLSLSLIKAALKEKVASILNRVEISQT